MDRERKLKYKNTHKGEGRQKLSAENNENVKLSSSAQPQFHCVRYFLSNFYFSPNDSPSKTMKNVFYFI